MKTSRVSKDEWISFANKANDANRNKMVSIVVTDDEKKVIDKTDKIAFFGIEVSSKDSENTIVQVVGGADASFTHFIDKVSEIYIEETEDSILKSIYIGSSLGRSAHIIFLRMDE